MDEQSMLVIPTIIQYRILRLAITQSNESKYLASVVGRDEYSEIFTYKKEYYQFARVCWNWFSFISSIINDIPCKPFNKTKEIITHVNNVFKGQILQQQLKEEEEEDNQDRYKLVRNIIHLDTSEKNLLSYFDNINSTKSISLQYLQITLHIHVDQSSFNNIFKNITLTQLHSLTIDCYYDIDQYDDLEYLLRLFKRNTKTNKSLLPSLKHLRINCKQDDTPDFYDVIDLALKWYSHITSFILEHNIILSQLITIFKELPNLKYLEVTGFYQDWFSYGDFARDYKTFKQALIDSIRDNQSIRNLTLKGQYYDDVKEWINEGLSLNTHIEYLVTNWDIPKIMLPKSIKSYHLQPYWF